MVCFLCLNVVIGLHNSLRFADSAPTAGKRMDIHFICVLPSASVIDYRVKVVRFAISQPMDSLLRRAVMTDPSHFVSHCGVDVAMEIVRALMRLLSDLCWLIDCFNA